VSAYLLAGASYLVLAVLLFWHVWSTHPASVTTCACGDPSAALWYTSWPAYAITHGLNPLFSTAVGYPTGVNLVFAAYGVVLAPLTWLFGPVVALNVGMTLGPVLSALAMFALVRRWVSWSPAAFVAGLLYGFSPFVVSNVAVAHADFSLVAIPPLVVICLDELLVRQRRRPVPVGVLLGALLSAQFLLGTEVLILLSLEIVLGVALVAVYAARTKPAQLRAHTRPAVHGALSAAVTMVVVAAFPAWFAAAGPAHFTSTVHPGLDLSALQASFGHFFVPPAFLTRGAFSSTFAHLVGGYQGPVVSPDYVGLGVVAVCAGGVLVFRRERVLWLFGILTVVSVLAATSAGSFVDGIPVLDQIVPDHFALLAFLGAAVMVGVTVDRTRDALRRRAATSASAGRVWGGLGALAVAAVALVPVAVYLAPAVPLTTQPVVVPAWFSTAAPALRGHPVVLALPAPFTATHGGLSWYGPDGTKYPLSVSGKEAAMTWQALDGQRTRIVGTGGLGAGAARRRAADLGQDVLSEVTTDYRGTVSVDAAAVAAVRRSLDTWGVTTVVLPDQPGLPAYDRVASVPEMAALVTAATSSMPDRVDGAWVWSDVGGRRTASSPDAAVLRRCVRSPAPQDVPSVASCVLQSART
jgi:hypothetical protein